MAESKVFQFFLLISFMIFSTHALEVYLTEDRGKWSFAYYTEINVGIDRSGLRFYSGCTKNKTFVARPWTTKVIVYIRSQAQAIRDTIWDQDHREVLYGEFFGYHYELLYLVVDGFKKGDERVLGDFLYQSIKPDSRQNNFQINTIGEGNMNLDYKTLLGDVNTYEENKKVFGGKLYEQIRARYR